MSVVQEEKKKIKLPKEILSHLLLEESMYEKEDHMRIAKAEQRRVFRKLLKDNNLLTEYEALSEKIRNIKKNLTDDLIPELFEYVKKRTEIVMKIKTDPSYQEASAIAREKTAEFKNAYKSLRVDFEQNIRQLLGSVEAE